ncbi:MAG: DTW domain-containing protein [Deltaproteobacteria bacterium]|nr:DTW domain-containing protein [Deltaproteobacteria bacterium]
MGSRSKMSVRCRHCRMQIARCICDLVPTLDIETRVVVVMHKREWAKTTATAHLAALAIPSCEIRLRGRVDEPLAIEDLLAEDRQSLLLYPSENATPLCRALVEADPRPVTLVVPDGSWRQAAKAARREAVLSALPQVSLPAEAPSRYRLRREPKREGLATFEAISRALGIIEGPEVRARLDAFFEAMVQRTLASRGAAGVRNGS